MMRPEVFAVPILMFADYFLTCSAWRWGEQAKETWFEASV